MEIKYSDLIMGESIEDAIEWYLQLVASMPAGEESTPDVLT